VKGYCLCFVKNLPVGQYFFQAGKVMCQDRKKNVFGFNNKKKGGLVVGTEPLV